MRLATRWIAEQFAKAGPAAAGENEQNGKPGYLQPITTGLSTSPIVKALLP